MGFLDDMFDPVYLFDNDHKQRADISALSQAVANSTSPREVAALRVRVNQLQLLCNGLVKMMELKGVATAVELETLVQQIDLLDGREDGRSSEVTWAEAPRCAHCNHFVNPDRDACIYCGRAIHAAGAGEGPYRGGPREPKVPARLATCAQCENRVPQNETTFTQDGELRCADCA